MTCRLSYHRVSQRLFIQNQVFSTNMLEPGLGEAGESMGKNTQFARLLPIYIRGISDNSRHLCRKFAESNDCLPQKPCHPIWASNLILLSKCIFIGVVFVFCCQYYNRGTPLGFFIVRKYRLNGKKIPFGRAYRRR